MNKKMFEPFTDEDNRKVRIVGIEVCEQLFKEFEGEENGIDLMSNVLLYGLSIIMNNFIDKDDKNYFIQVIHKTLSVNIHEK